PAAAAEGDDGFAVVGGGGAVGAGLGPAVQGQTTSHAGHGPGAVAQVDQPDGTSHGGTPSRRTAGGLGPVGQGLDQGVDQRGVEAAVATEGAPVLQAAFAGPAGDGLGRHVQPGGGLAGPSPALGCGHGFTSLRAGRDRGHAATTGKSSDGGAGQAAARAPTSKANRS